MYSLYNNDKFKHYVTIENNGEQLRRLTQKHWSVAKKVVE